MRATIITAAEVYCVVNDWYESIFSKGYYIQKQDEDGNNVRVSAKKFAATKYNGLKLLELSWLD